MCKTVLLLSVWYKLLIKCKMVENVKYPQIFITVQYIPALSIQS